MFAQEETGEHLHNVQVPTWITQHETKSSVYHGREDKVGGTYYNIQTAAWAVVDYP